MAQGFFREFIVSSAAVNVFCRKICGFRTQFVRCQMTFQKERTTKHIGIYNCPEENNNNDEIKVSKTFEDNAFDVLSDGKDTVPVSKFLQALQKVGIRRTDPRLQSSMQKLSSLQEMKYLSGSSEDDIFINRDTFKDLISDNVELVKRILTANFVIPEFPEFCSIIKRMYDISTSNMSGMCASYIKQLARVDPRQWAVGICTTDGQRYSIGDFNVPFCLQSVSKSLSYALVLSDLGEEIVHSRVGHEPSGEQTDSIKLNSANKPHNAMINSGGMAVTSLIKNDYVLADRYDYALAQYKRFAGYEFIRFNNAIYLAERATADRNYAMAYYMRENKCFPEGTNLSETLDLYFQLCSIEITAESGAVIAATLANGGICPTTNERIVAGEAVRNTLAVMHSCGMYDYSGEFAFKVGLPAKSGMSGVILLVVPNVMGVCLWSPPLDELDNSCRGVQFSEELVKIFNFHQYDNLKYSARKVDPRYRQLDREGHDITTLLFGAAKGDLTALRRMALADVVDMRLADYDGRTALHLAAAEGHLECVKFLLEVCKVPVNPLDRWGHTPLDDAINFNRDAVADLLQKYHVAEKRYSSYIDQN